MKIIVQQNSDTAKVEIDTKNCNYQWSFRDALILAMTIEGFQKSFIDAVFNQATFTDDTYNQVLEKLTPIQLPSDDEIGKDIGSGMHDFYKGGFIEGAKWMKEQILQPNL